MVSLILNIICFLVLLYYLTESLDLTGCTTFRKYLIRILITTLMTYLIVDSVYGIVSPIKWIIHPATVYLTVKYEYFNKLLFKGLGHSK